MSVILWGTAILTVVSLALSLLGRLVCLLVKFRPRRFWRRLLVAHLVLIPIFALLVVPAVMGWFASRMIGTRSDERAYAGPIFAADGRWVYQSRESLRAATAETGDAAADHPSADPSPHAVRFTTEDGLSIRGFLVEPRDEDAHERPALSVVMVHGLFRGALELEEPASWFRDLGAEVLIVELRNHGGSDRAPATFGLREARDVEAAVRFLHSRPGHADDPIVLFGVSLGTAAVALAAPHVSHLAGLVLDSPLTSLRATARRMFAPRPAAPADSERRRSFGLPEPFQTLVLFFAELWSGFRLSAVRPLESLAQLPKDLPALIVAGSEDDRMPPETVREAYEALRGPEGVKELWIRAGSEHAEVWTDDPDGYRARLRSLLRRVRSQVEKAG